MAEPLSWLTTGDVAKLIGHSQSAVSRWADAGKLVSSRTPGGHRRFLLVDVEAFRERWLNGSAA